MYRKHTFERMPTQLEQDIVEEYLKRQLYRPNTNIVKAILYIVLLIIICEIITFIVGLVINVLAISFEPSVHIGVINNNTWSDVIYINLIVLLIVFFFTLRITLIGLVHLYQHYAPEWMRRRCMCKPSCSEYMILAVKKYGPFIGTAKGIKRLVKTCDGIVYKIDYP